MGTNPFPTVDRTLHSSFPGSFDLGMGSDIWFRPVCSVRGINKPNIRGKYVGNPTFLEFEHGNQHFTTLILHNAYMLNFGVLQPFEFTLIQVSTSNDLPTGSLMTQRRLNPVQDSLDAYRPTRRMTARDPQKRLAISGCFAPRYNSITQNNPAVAPTADLTLSQTLVCAMFRPEQVFSDLFVA